MTEVYMIYEVGFEGIYDTHGPYFNSDVAIEVLETMRAEYLEKAVGDDKWLYTERAKRLCLRRGSNGGGLVCVCREFGLGSDELILY